MADTAGERPAQITVQLDGPYQVTGGVSLKRRSIVSSEHGEPLTWQTGARLETRASYALCRCGASNNKPFCDGSHLRSLFDGTETAATSAYDERATVYQGTGVEMRDDRSICEHAGFCGNRLTNVWEMVGGGGTDDSVVRSQVIAMVERCPSGALTYRLPGEEADIEPDLAPGIGVTADGPYFVTGGVSIQSANGQAYEKRNRVTLCRCGASAHKPLCDGAHKAAGFHDS